MPTAVQIVLTLDDKGVVTGAKNASAAISGIGAQTQAAGAKASSAFSGIESAEQRAHTAALLFTRTTGVEMPRALETVIAKSKLLGPLLSGLFNLSVFAAAGAAIIAVGGKLLDLSKEAEQHRQAWIDIDATVQDSSDKIVDELNKQKQKYIELTQGPIAAMKFEIANMRSVALSAFSDIAQQMKMVSEEFAREGGFFGKGPINNDVADEVKGVLADMNQAMHEAATKNPKDLLAPLIAEQQELQKAVIDTETLIGRRAAAMGADKSLLEPLQHQLAFYQQINSQIGIQIELQKASTKAAGQDLIETQKHAYDQVIALRHQVDEDQLGGIAKIRKQESDAIDDVIRKEKDKGVAIQHIAEIHRQSAERERQAELDVAKSIRDAQLFAEERANSVLQGSSKIIADADHEKDVLLENLGDYLARSQYTAEEVEAAWDAYYIKRDAIDKATNQKLAMNQQQLLDKLVDEQQRAAIAALPEWQRADAQILLDHKKTYDELNRLEAQDAGNFEIYEREKAAADALTNAQLIENHKRMTIELGSDLESIYDDIGSGKIGQRILANIKKLFFQIVAQWLLATQTMGSVFGKLFGTLLGGPQSSLENASGGGFGSLLGLFGLGGTPASATVGGVAGGSAASAAVAAGGPSALTTALGLGGLFGGSAVPGTASVFGASGALTTASVASTGAGAGSVATGALGLAASGGASKTIFGNFLGGLKGAAGIAALLPALFGGALGGKVGQLGGTLFSSAFLLGPLLAHLGISSALAPLILGPLAYAGGGLLGFGIGEKFGTLGGILGGAGSGAGLGFLVGGPIGALIGGIIGLLGGLFGGLFGGGKRKKAANNFFDQQIAPAIKKIEDDYKGFSIDFSTANQELEDLRKQAEDSLKKLKGEGKDVFRKKVSPAIDQAEKEIGQFQTERDRRAGLVFGPPQFHEGGFVAAAMQPFMRPGEIMALLKHGEFVVNPQATAKHRPQLERANAGMGLGTVLNGDIYISPATLDKAYIRGQFLHDLRDALDRLDKEGR